MSGTRSRSARTTRRAIALAVGALVVVLLPIGAASGHGKPDRDRPADTPLATDIVFSDITTPSIELPDTPGADGLFYVVGATSDNVGGTPFNVDLQFTLSDGTPAPLSTNKDVTVTVTYDDTAIGQAEVAAKATDAHLSGLRIATPASGVVLEAFAEPKQGAEGMSDEFDVLIESNPVLGRTVIGGADGTATECNATPEEPVCADLVPPENGTFGPNGQFSRGLCAPGDQCQNTFIQALVALEGAARDNPASLIMKCDKTLCEGGAIKRQKLTVTLAAGGPGNEAPACRDKNTVLSAPDKFCVDYVQSTRDNAGDTILYLLFIEDAKVRFS